MPTVAEAKKKAAKKDGPDFSTGGLTWSEGDLAAKDPEGREWAPIACGEHRAVVPFSTTAEGYEDHTHYGRPFVSKPRATGYVSRCDACKSELDSTVDSFLRNGGV